MNKMFTQPSGSTAKMVNKQSIARDNGIKVSDVTYLSTDASINGYTVLYDPISQTTWLTGNATGTPISWSVTGSGDTLLLNTSAGSFTCYPASLEKRLAESTGASSIGTSSGQTVEDALESVQLIGTRQSGVTMAMFPRLMAKLSAYRHGVAGYQTEYRIWGFGSSVGNGATIGGNSSAFTPVAKFFEYLNATVNRTGIYPFTVANKSVDGSSINDFLVRDWAAATSGGVYPDLAVFAYGMNDFPTALYNAGATFGENGFKERLRKAIRLVKEAGGDVVLMTSPHPCISRYSWSMPSVVSQVWPSPSPAPVSDANIIPSATLSTKVIKWRGVDITVAIRFLRGNDAMRQVAIEEGCVLLDAEKFWFDGLAKNGELAMFDEGQTVHPNYLGHASSYQPAAKLFFDCMDDNGMILPAPSKNFTLTVGGTALNPNPATADVDLMAIGQRSISFVRRDKNARILESLTNDGVFTQYSYTLADPTVSSPGYNASWSAFTTRTKGLYAAGETQFIAVPNRTTKKLIIDAWTSSRTEWAQCVELIITNREGVITFTVVGNHDQTPPAGSGSTDPSVGGSRLFTYAVQSGGLLITTLVDNTSLKYRIEGFNI